MWEVSTITQQSLNHSCFVTLLLPCFPYPQMTKVLDLLQSYLEQKGHRACRIDGSIPWQVRLPTPASPRSTPWSMSICMHSLGVGLPVMYVQVLGYQLWGDPGSKTWAGCQTCTLRSRSVLRVQVAVVGDADTR